jgi:hypothetical protein
MRTTLTLEDDVAVLLAQVQEERKETFKDVVNTALRTGLVAMTKPEPPRPVIRTKSFNTGKCLLPNLDCIGEVLEFLDGPGHK